MTNCIEYKKMISSLSDTNLELLIHYADLFITFLCKKEEITKSMLIEKVYDYIEIIEIKNKIKSFDLPSIYVNELLSLLNGHVEKKSRAWKYLEYEKNIAKNIRKMDNEQIRSKLVDFTRVFLCMYSEIVTNESSISSFNFSVESIHFEEIMKKLLNGKEIRGIVRKEEQKYDRYCKKSFSFLLLSIYYLGIKESISNLMENE